MVNCEECIYRNECGKSVHECRDRGGGQKQIAEPHKKLPRNKLEVATQAGLLTAKYYDDGIAEGIQISLGGDIIAMIDVYKEENAECRVLTYKVDQDEPYRCVSVNRS